MSETKNDTNGEIVDEDIFADDAEISNTTNIVDQKLSEAPAGVAEKNTSEEDKTTDDEEEEAVVAGVEAVGRVSLRMHKMAAPFKKFWAHKLIAIPVLIFILVGIVAAVWFTPARYTVLNAVSSSSLEIIVKNAENDLAIAGAEVRAGDVYATTNAEGYALLEGVKYGDVQVTVIKNAYEGYESTISFNESRVSLSDIVLQPIGSNFSVKVQNSISGEPISDVVVKYMDVTSKTDKKGAATLIIPPSSKREIELSFEKEGYSSVAKTALVKKGEAAVSMLPDGKNIFFSNRSGQIDLYESDLAGKNQKIILAGTGNESTNISLSTSPDNKWAAIVSTRDGDRNDEGALVPALYVLNLETNVLTKADEGAELFSIQGWADGRIVYELSLATEDYKDNKRAKIKTYDPVAGTYATLVAANSADTKAVLGNNIIYTFRLYEDEGDTLQSALPDASSKKDLLKIKQSYVQTASQTSPAELTLTAYNYADDVNQRVTAYTYSAISDSLTKLDQTPANVVVRRTVASLNNKKVAWVENRDGQDRLFVAEADGSNQQIITSKRSISYPIKWIGDNYIIFRVTDNNETADYVIAAHGEGEAKKIVDVFFQSYYYGPYY